MPEVACATMRARGSTPSARARSSDVTTTADAPSLTPGALPAVTVPDSLNAGLSFERASRRVFTNRLVGVENNRSALLLRNLDGQNLVLKLSGLDCGGGLAV